MSQKKSEIVLYVVPLFDCVIVPISGKKKESLTLITGDKNFQEAFDEAVGNAGSDAVFDQFKFLDLGEQKGEAFLKSELGTHLWIAITCELEDFKFERKFDEINSRRASPTAKKREKQNIISEFMTSCDGDGIFEFLEFLVPFVEGRFNSGECASFKEKLGGFFDDLNAFMESKDYINFSEYENSRPTPADDVVKDVAREIASFRTKFFELVNTFCDLWEKYFKKVKYVLKEEFDDFKESVGDDLKEKIDSVERDVGMLKKEVADLRSQVGSVRKDFDELRDTVKEEFEQLRQGNAELRKMCDKMTAFLASKGDFVKKVQEGVEQCVRDSQEAQSRASEAQIALNKAYEAYGSGHH